MKKKILCLLIVFTVNFPLQAQDVINSDVIYLEGMLLNNPLVQIEATAAVNDMYNFKFERAENQFNWFKEKYPEHPLPYFLLGLNEWWKIMPNSDIKSYDDTFMNYMDISIEKAKGLLDSNANNVEASFFLAAAYAFKCRLHSERRNWTRATFTGKSSLNYLRRGREINELSPELMLGDALYNYYSVYIPKNYPLLKPIMMFFKKGDPVLGLEQLEEVAKNAFYTRTEAQYHLMRIYRNEEKKPEKALPIAEYLNKTFPDNAYFQRSYLALCYSMGLLNEAEKVGKEILSKIDMKMAGYEAIGGRYASYILAYIAKAKYQNTSEIQKYYLQTLAFAEESKSFDSGYYQSALFELGKIAHNQKEFSKAEKYFLKVRKYCKKKSRIYKEATKYLKDYKKM